jgi:4'-phosphopantetheinyl transferase
MLIWQHRSPQESNILVWSIDEDAAYYLSQLQMSDYDQDQLHAFQSEGRRLQWLASRFALRSVLETPDFIDMRKDDKGKPILHNMEAHVSLSHTNKWVAAISNRNATVGIDLELKREKIERLANKFVNEEEWKNVPEADNRQMHLLTIWSAKEALYKLYGAKELDFRDHMQLGEFKVAAEGSFKANIKKDDFYAELLVQFKWFEEHVLTWVEQL